MKFTALLLSIHFLFSGIPVFGIIPNKDAMCSNHDGHEICILNIQRSAKRYWNYRVAISVDGEKKPVEVYNCRGRFKIQRNGKVVPFEENGAGKLICKYFKK
ncbi:hypothetical protein [Mastigocoleus sp. MO_188.B34]|uniref:hypothetical protein n=1 Tax=Mastigocoleus sp. MO_188.B34 TaxID=3036635 RepID=UPI002607D282|nr:hypothetical protein [Mastigocoleus sp. MO_188.B34]MDJ0695908.1 hypothetical protein [Mastigocoleus sp. MO_188.B34]